MSSWINPQLIAVLIFVATYLLIATGKREQTVAAMAGAIAVWAFQILTGDEILHVIDLDTLGILFGMMIIVGALRESGFFRWMGILLANFCRCKPSRMFIVFTITTAFLSAFLYNITTVLFIVVVTIEIMEVLHLNPVPYIIGEILASNIGGTATMIGDPPNILISSVAGFTFLDFILNTMPICVVNLIITTFMLYRYLFRREFQVTCDFIEVPINPRDVIQDQRLFKIGLMIFTVVIVLLFLQDRIGISPLTIVMVGGVCLLFVGGEKMPEVLEKVDWSILIFLACLFIIVGGLEKTGVIHLLASQLTPIIEYNNILAISAILWVSSVASAFIDNVPYSVAFIPILEDLIATQSTLSDIAWWALALGTGFGGNGTVIGAASYIVAIGIASKMGYNITFKDFLKIGMITLLVTTAVANLYLIVRLFFS